MGWGFSPLPETPNPQALATYPQPYILASTTCWATAAPVFDRTTLNEDTSRGRGSLKGTVWVHGPSQGYRALVDY